MKQNYITTPIYYVNDKPHIGHAYTTIICDLLKKYAEINGIPTFLLTGTDENGQKIEQAATAHNTTPQKYADMISAKFRSVWDSFDIDYDKYMRTTDLEHRYGVQKAFELMYKKGDIYKGEYEGHYCVSCESFFTATQVIDELYCPDCGKPTTLVKEESYFFALSKYQDRLLKWYEENPTCILPLHKRNEVVRFVSDGLQDLSITRTSFDWGVKIPESLNDPKHIVYVWLDALLNYVSALGYGLDYKDAKEALSKLAREDIKRLPSLESKMELFNNTTHVVGKDILRFHAIYWPAFLMSLDLPLPRQILAHGWWTREGVKMSKSLGNVIDPLEVKEAYGTEAFRYFLLKEVPFGQDGDFSELAFKNRINGELSNDLGNLLNRLIGMSEKYFSFSIEGSKEELEKDYKDELEKIDSIISKLASLMENVQFHLYLEGVWELLTLANGLITKMTPWTLMKEGRIKECNAFLVLIANILLKTALLLYPFLPKSTKKIGESLGVSIDANNYKHFIKEKGLKESFHITKCEALFPKVEDLRMQTTESKKVQETKVADSKTKDSKTKDFKVDSKNQNLPESSTENLISIEEFKKIDIRVGKIVSATEVPKSTKLLKLEVDLNEGRLRQILAGIKETYTSESLVGRQVVVLANLKPAKLMGLTSEGMLLACKDENGLNLLSIENSKILGSKIS
ncbi:methionine--tRNA ligase [Helicobacter sp. 13S00401-1]|uniref:methionine--tRNA ligase n=1 Tax=Helicobacter sp. 13S00401-1 TaxID=1905758 RepID=UPI000BA6D4BA|nr:methionine--tRNA ligase [Helicobacter sp. 13S00401-1]PAF50356.1 methionine--tRNA ligase [Helicobacter sp. 13S00401-1]